MKPLWTPSSESIADANMTRFLDVVRTDVPAVDNFESLYRWSIDEPAAFWDAVRRFCGILSSVDAETVVRDFDKMPGAKWFPGMRLNFAENLLRFRDERVALVAWNEEGRGRSLTYADLADEVARLAAALRAQGTEPGDRVAAFLPNLPQTVVAMLATTSLGATWSSCSPDFGVQGVLDRFGQIRPKVLFTADAYLFGGKTFDCLDKVRQIAAAIPEIEKIVVIPYRSENPDLGFDKRSVLWSDFLDASASAADLDFAQLPFDHPLYIMYSSGTTGLPKCMVHGVGGTLIQHLKELVLHTDLRRDDKIFYFTTCGWMMWNWLVSGLAVGASVVLYDGSPMKPTADALWRMAAEEGVTIFGTSAKYLALVEKEGVRPRCDHNLGALRSILSTGSPLAPESYDYVYREIGEEIRLSSISGGTDIISCFALGNPIAPVWRGELQTRGLGMKVEVWNESGEPVLGEKGELVCVQPFPSMPVAFWNDPDGEKYHRAYFDVFPNIWRHGDWAELTERGGMIIHGRSDATLNPGGVRIGTAEIYNQVEQFDEVVEALVVGQEWDGDTRIVLFLRMREGVDLDETLRDRMRRQIRANASPFHVPKKILQVEDIPRTRSGKITEIAVRELIHGREVKNVEALANPGALDFFRDLEELRS